MYDRFIASRLKDALAFSPAVYLAGPRQSGKSTLVETLYKDREYLSFDNLDTAYVAKSTPMEFINSLNTPCILDEIQRAPEVILPIKESVDKYLSLIHI